MHVVALRDVLASYEAKCYRAGALSAARKRQDFSMRPEMMRLEFLRHATAPPIRRRARHWLHEGAGGPGRCYLKGHAGNAAKRFLTGAKCNFRHIPAWLRVLLWLVFGGAVGSDTFADALCLALSTYGAQQ